MRALVFLVLGLLSFAELQAQQEPFLEDLKEPFLEDLKLLSSRISHYKADDLPVDEALELLCKEAGIPGVFTSYEDEQGNQISPAEMNRIKLDLKDVAAGEVIHYIAELGGCRTKFWGWPGAPMLCMIKVTAEDDRGLFHRSIWMECPVEAAKVLGLKAGMNDVALRNIFERYGAEFGREAAVVWNEKSGLLAVRGEVTGMIPAMVKLAAKGHLRPLGEAR